MERQDRHAELAKREFSFPPAASPQEHQGRCLTLDTIRRHLDGEITIGLYAINPATQCSKWVAIDADYQDALADLARIHSQLLTRP